MNPRKLVRSAMQDELLLDRPAVAREESWRVLRILGDFVEGFETLAGLGPAVAVFGSARVSRRHRYYAAALEAGAGLARAGFAAVTVVAQIQRCHSRAGGSREPGE